MKKIQGTYDELVDRYATLTLGRCAVLVALLVALFFIFGGMRHGDGSREPARLHSPPSVPVFRKGRTMYDPHERVRINILPGYIEPENLAPRVLFTAVCDFSGSMEKYVEQLPIAWKAMLDTLAKQPEARQRAMLACCAFDDRVSFQDYAPLSFYSKATMQFAGGGGTNLAAALLTTIERTQACRAQIDAAGMTCYRTLIAVITDGQAGDAEQLPDVTRQIVRAEQQGEIDFVPIAPNVDDMDRLERIFRKQPIPLKKLDYEFLFRGFARSMSIYSRSMCGAEPDGRTLIANSLDAIQRGTLLSGPDSGKRLLNPGS